MQRQKLPKDYITFAAAHKHNVRVILNILMPEQFKLSIFVFTQYENVTPSQKRQCCP